MDHSEQPTAKVPTLSVRLSLDERTKLETSAKKADLTLSKYVRQILIGEADVLDDLISKRGRQRHLPDLETISALSRANIRLDRIAEALTEANRVGSSVTLRLLVAQLEDIQETLTAIRRSRK